MPALTYYSDKGFDWLEGHIVSGYGVASGCSKKTPYPEGSIKLQTPYFQKNGLDISSYWPGTINVSFEPTIIHLQNPNYSFKNINWTDTVPPEDFSFWKTFLEVQTSLGVTLKESFIYLPHRSTKTIHHQSPYVLEILAPYISSIDTSFPVRLGISTDSYYALSKQVIRAKLIEALKFRILSAGNLFFETDNDLSLKRRIANICIEANYLSEAEIDEACQKSYELYVD
ncbi:hypothetical protein [Prochlorococcus sp. MIT 1300]|uniref:hypothetical protein n=1 Tax=Prochlorococcus sp. MIT 1300 TaxID=3096218 RepID=UPI002A7637D4|nr:hypothetical protein [Prochlorococcus sp. MIT 1300]